MLSSIMNGGACRIRLVVTPMVRASASSGSVPTQYLLQSMARRSSGLERRSQSWRPSRETEGKMKRAAIAESTKPASPWLRNTTRVTST